MKLSIVVPIYNAEKYLERCLSSVLSQTFRDFELLMVNVGSTDSSLDICKKYEKTDSRIRIFKTINGGPAKARNLGIDQARSLYLGFVDADDYIHRTMYERMLHEDISTNCSVVMCDYYIVGNNIMNNIHAYDVDKHLYKDEMNLIFESFYAHKRINGIWTMWNKIFKNEFIKQKAILIDENLARGENAWFIFDVLSYANNISYINVPLYFYLQDNENSIMSLYRKDQFVVWEDAAKRLLKYNNEIFRFNIDYIDFYTQFIIDCFGFMHRSMIYLHNKSERREIIFYVLESNIYNEAIRHDKRVRYIIRLFDFINKLRLRKIAYLLLFLISVTVKR